MAAVIKFAETGCLRNAPVSNPVQMNAIAVRISNVGSEGRVGIVGRDEIGVSVCFTYGL